MSHPYRLNLSQNTEIKGGDIMNVTSIITRPTGDCYRDTEKVVRKESTTSDYDQVQISGKKPEIPEGIHKEWLFLNYIAADCDLTPYQLANIDNQEKTGSDESTHIVALIDVGPDLNPMDQSWSGARTYYVTKDAEEGRITSPVIAEHGKNVNMVDPKTLTNFIIENVKKFPADNVALVLNDHGSGFRGAMSDVHDGRGQLSMPQIRQALEEAEKVTGKKIDVLGFDACMMADTQTAYELKDCARYLVASEETEGGAGWDYAPMLTNVMTDAIKELQLSIRDSKLNVSPEVFVKNVVAECEKHQADMPTMSATDLTKMGDLGKSIDSLARSIIDTTKENKDLVRAAIVNAECYAGGWSTYRDYHDLGHMVNLIDQSVTDDKLKQAAQGVKDALGKAVIANEVSKEEHPNSTGLHIYAPTVSSSDYMLMFGYKGLELSKDTMWDEAILDLEKNLPHG